MDNNSFNSPVGGENEKLNQPLFADVPKIAPTGTVGALNAVPNSSPNASGSAAPALSVAASFSHRVKTDAFDKLAMVINFFLTLGFIKNATYGADWKIFVYYLGIFVLATAYIVVKQKRFNIQAALSGTLCVALSFSFALRDNPSEINFGAILMLMYLSGSYCLALTGANRHGRGSYFFLLDFVKTEFLLPFRYFFLPYMCMHNTRLDKRNAAEKKKLDKKYIAAIIGIVCAVPVLLIVIPLLVKSDAAFESIAGTFSASIEKILAKISNNRSFNEFIDDNIFAFIPTVFIAPYIFSVMFSFRHGVSNEANKDTSKSYAKLRVGSPALFAGFLGVICLVYVIYILSQAVYIFGAFGGKLPEGVELSVSEYARRGFFELAGVAAVNLVLIAVTVLFGRRDEGGNFKLIIKIFDLFLCAFNILLSVVSISKIVLYMNKMGLTHKRIYVLIIDILMIIAFLCIAARIFKKEFPYMRVITAAVCVAITVLSLVGIDRIIAEHNTEKFLNGKLYASSAYDVTDGYGLGAFESYLKIAKSKTAASKSAMNVFYLQYVRDEESVCPMTYDSKGKVYLNETENAIFGDAASALTIAKENFDFIKTYCSDIEESLLDYSMTVGTEDAVYRIDVKCTLNDTESDKTCSAEKSVGDSEGFESGVEVATLSYYKDDFNGADFDSGDNVELASKLFVVKDDGTRIPVEAPTEYGQINLGGMTVYAGVLTGSEKDGYKLIEDWQYEGFER